MSDRVLIGARRANRTDGARWNCPAWAFPSASSTSRPLPRRRPVPSASRPRITAELLELRGLAEEMVRLGNPGLAASFYGGGKRGFGFDFTRIDSRHHYLPVHIAGRDRAHPAHGGREAGCPDRRGVELVGRAQDVLSPDPNPVRVVLRHAAGRLEQGAAALASSPPRARTASCAGHPRPSLRGQDARGAVRLGRPAPCGQLAETDLHIFSSAHGFLGLFPMGNRALPPDGQQPSQPAQQGHGTDGPGVASDLRPAACRSRRGSGT